MHPTKNSLPEKVRTQICGLLQDHLCNSLDLVGQAKQAHWNVKGPHFMSLHQLFDKIAEDAEGYVDVIAERIVQLGGTAEGTLQVVAKRTRLPTYPINISSDTDHLNSLAHSLAVYGESVRVGIGLADELTDKGTADIFTEISREVDKHLWFVESHAQPARGESLTLQRHA